MKKALPRLLFTALISIAALPAFSQVTLNLNRFVSSSSDDAEEYAPGTTGGTVGAVDLSSSDLELVKDGTKEQHIGVRFLNITIPNGAVITGAYIQFTTHGDKDPVSGNIGIRAEAVDNPGAFAATSFNVSARSVTTDSVLWPGSIDASWGAGAGGTRGVVQRTTDLTSLVQQTVNRPGWVSGNAISFIIKGFGVRNAYSYNGSAALAPELVIQYQGAIAPPPPAMPVINFPIPKNSQWYYLDDGSNQGTAWTLPGFDNSYWAFGPAKLGYSDNPATILGYGPSASNKYKTYYFRKRFNVPSVAALTDPLMLELLRDDGAVVYINGVEVARSNMPDGSINYQTLAASASDGAAETQYFVYGVPTSLLVDGENTIAVEVHQNVATSSDLGFDLALTLMPKSTLLRGPYLQVATSSGMNVRWRTDLPVRSTVRYGTDPAALTMTATDAAYVTDHEVKLTGLAPHTKYWYSISAATDTLQGDTSNYFMTLPVAGTKGFYRVGVFGDCGNNSTNQRNVRDQIQNYLGNNYMDSWILLGDNAYNGGTDAQHQTGFFNIYKDRFLKQNPLFPAPGNHDYADTNINTATHNIPYFNIFSVPTNAEAGGLASNNKSYYSYDLGNAHFISLDSYGQDDNGTTRLYDTSGAQATWVKNDLAANANKDWIVVYLHHPPFTMGSHNSDTEAELVHLRENFVQILERNGVDLVLSGHSHDYERSRLQKGHYGTEGTFDANSHNLSSSSGTYNGTVNSCPYVKDSASGNQGTVYVVSGSSGQLGGVSAGYPHNAMQYSNANNGGAIMLEIQDTRLDVKWICSDGVIRDKFTIMKKVNKQDTTTISIGQSIALKASWIGNYAWNTGAVSKTITVAPSVDSMFQVKDDNSQTCLTDKHYVKVASAPVAAFFSSCPSNISVTAVLNATGAAVNYSAVATGSPAATVSYVFTGATTGSGNGTGTGTIFNIGITHVMLTATNTGGTVNCSFDVTVAEAQPSFTTCPANSSITAATGAQTAVVNYTAAATGASIPAVSYVFSGATTGSGNGTGSGSSFNIGVTSVTLTATNAGGSTTCSFTVTVSEALPSFTACPGNIATVATANGSTAVVSYTATATGTSLPAISYTFTGATIASGSGTGSGSVFNIGVTNVVVSAVNGGGTATCSFTITVNSLQSPILLNRFVSGSSNDAEEAAPGSVGVTVGTMDVSGSDLELMQDGTREQYVGTRFTDIAIPAGAVITNAYVQFSAKGDKNAIAGDVVIRAEASDNTAAFSSTSFNISSRTVTVDSVKWLGSSDASWGVGSVGTRGPNQKTPNIAALIQNIINRPGWVKSNALSLIFKGSGVRNAYSSDGSSTLAPELVVEYNIPSNPAMATITFPVPKNAQWYYLDNGSSQGAAWKQPSYNALWSFGAAKLGYSDAPVTTLSFGPSSGAKYPTYYFRKKFMVPSVAALTDSVVINVLRDDGAVVYINDSEVVRTNMPVGTIAYSTLASSASDGAAETTYFTYKIPKGVLVDGENTIAVELHQNVITSSDLGFDLELKQDTIIVVAPAFTACPSNTSVVAATGATHAQVNYTATASGTPVPALTYSLSGATTGSGSGTASGAQFNIGVTNVVITANNSGGNASCSFAVTVNEGAPQFTSCPTNMSVAAPLSQASAVVSYAAAATGASAPLMTYSLSGATTGSGPGTGTGLAFNIGLTNVIISATTPGGTVTCSFTINVAEAAPVLSSCPGNISQTAAPNSGNKAVTYTVSANGLTTPVMSYVFTGAITGSGSGTGSGSLFNIGTTNVVVTATTSGGSVNCSFSVIMLEGAPVFSNCPSNIPVTAVTPAVSKAVSYTAIAGGFTAPSLTYVFTGATTAAGSGTGSGSLFNIGTTQVSITATGPGGTANCSFNVVIVEGQPSFTNCPANIAETAAPGSGSSVINYTSLVSSATSPVVSYAFTGATVASGSGNGSGQAFNIGVTQITITATNSGGSNTCQFTITINAAAPAFTACPANMNTQALSGASSAAVSYNAAASSVPAPVMSYVFSGATTGSGSGTGSGSMFNIGTTNVTVTAANAGGSVTCSFTLTVTEAAPAFTACPGNISQTVPANTSNAVVNYTANAAGITSPIVGYTLSGATTGSGSGTGSGLSFNLGTTNVIVTATSPGGTATCSFSVTLAGVQSPVYLSRMVKGSSNDAEEVAPGSIAGTVGAMDITNSDLELMKDASKDQLVGIRLTDVTIPAGAIITNAYVQFSTKGDKNPVMGNVIIKAQAEDNPAAFTTTAFNISSRPVTADSIIWPGNTDPSWGIGSQGVRGVNQRTADISSLVQNIVNRPGWATGNAMCLIFTGSGVRNAYAYDGNNFGGPELVVEYSLPVASPMAVSNLPVPRNSSWYYLDNGSDQGTAWKQPGYTSSWPYGPGKLGYSDAPATTISFGPDAAVKYPASYFRKKFNVPSVSALADTLILELLRDDGAVVYINGTEAVRSNMPATVIGYQTLASSPSDGTDESSYFNYKISKSLLVNGENTIAVEVHQNNVNSADLGFDLALQEQILTPVAPSFTTCPANINLTAGSGASQAVAGYAAAAGGYPAPTITYTMTGATTASGTGTGSGSQFHVGTTTVTITATNVLSSATCTFTVTVAEAAPSFSSCPANISVAAPVNASNMAVSYVAAATGFTAPSLSYSFTGATTGSGSGTGSGSLFNVGATNVTLTATNPGGSSTCSFIVTITEPAPVFTACPGNLSAMAASMALSTAVSYTATASGMTAPVMTYAFTGATVGSGSGTGSGALFNIGTTNVIVTATNTGGAVTCSFTVTVAAPQSPIFLSRKVNAGSGDAEEYGPGSNGGIGTVDAASSDLELMQDGNKVQYVGVRFADIVIPAGAVINNAYVQFTTRGDKNPVSGAITIKGEASDNATDFTSAMFNVSGRPVTADSVIWSGSTDASWGTTGGGSRGAEQRTPDISSLIQATINRSGWVKGNGLSLILKGSGVRNAYSYEGSSTYAPELVVEYTVPANTALPVTSFPVQKNGQWHYLDNGSDQFAGWRLPSYNTVWASGSAILGYGDGPATTVSYGPTSGNKYVTTYFRKKFNVPSVTALTDTISLGLLRDDGAIVYINGVEVIRSNMPAGAVNFATLASSAADGNNETSYFSYKLPKSVLVDGDNTIAVEVHQNVKTSSDLSFDLELKQDLNPVVLVCPGNQSANTPNNSCAVTVTYAATSPTVPAPAFSYTLSGATMGSGSGTGSGSLFSRGVTTVTVKAARPGDTASCSFTVTVTDNKLPAITAPANKIVNSNPGSCFASGVSLGTPVTTDNCTVASVTSNAPAQYPTGVTTVTWTVTDASGNTATAAQTVTVKDVQNPAITAPPTAILNVNPGQCYATNVPLGNPAVSDNCSGVTLTNNAPVQFIKGSTIVTWTATDASGNTATATQTVTVKDNIKPTIIAPPSLTFNNYCSPIPASQINLGIPVTADNCGVDSVYNDAPVVFPFGKTDITWTVKDAAGNKAEIDQSVWVTKAALVLNAVKTHVSCNGGTNGALDITFSGGTLPYSYDWGGGVTTEDRVNIPAGTYPVSVSDAHGCVKTGSFAIIQPGLFSMSLASTPSYFVSGQEINTIYLGYGTQSGTLAASGLGSTGPFTFSWTPGGATTNSIAVAPTTSTTYTVAITNANGCTQTVSRTIEVKDVRAPGGNIYVCHGGVTTSVVSSAVSSHLGHGDQLGSCGAGKAATSNMGYEAVEMHMDIYPNPSTGLFNIEMDGYDASLEGELRDMMLLVTDINGKVVVRQSISQSLDQLIPVDLSQQPKGIYMVRLSDNGKTYQSKIVLQ
jgi:hypothetical protein